MKEIELLLINQYINEIAKGDERSLFLLYKLIGGRLLSIALGITRDSYLAEEVVQETLIKIVKYAKTFVHQDNGYGWICTIIRNEAMTLLKKNNTDAVSLDEFYFLADTIESAQEDDKKIAISLALKKLSEEERELIWYKYTLGMSVRDIALKINLSKSTVAMRINDAEEKLREFLKE